jgi:hypothetical protein
MTSKWEQLEIPGIPGVTKSFHNTPARPEYGFDQERGDVMLSITIKINETELYEVEAYLQPGGDLEGICTYKIIINGEETGFVQHDRTDGAWELAGLIFCRFPAQEKTLQEEGGAHTGGLGPDALRKALDAYRDELVYDEATASVALAREVHRHFPQAGDPQ